MKNLLISLGITAVLFVPLVSFAISVPWERPVLDAIHPLFPNDQVVIGGTSTTTESELFVNGDITATGLLDIDGTGTSTIAGNLDATGDIAATNFFGDVFVGALEFIDSSKTEGSVAFYGANGQFSEDNTNFFWDDTSNFLRTSGVVSTASSTITDVLHADGTISFQDLFTFDAETRSGVNRLVLKSALGNNDAELFLAPTGSNVGSEVTFSDSPNANNFGGLQVGTDGTINFVSATSSGTGTVLPIAFKIHDTEAMRIATDGNVGIGKSVPTSTLHVAGGDVHFENGVGSAGFFWDQSLGYLGIGTTTPVSHLHVSDDHEGGAFNNLITTEWISTSPANNDQADWLELYMADSGGARQQYVRIRNIAQDITAGSEDGRLQFSVVRNGTLEEAISIDSDEIIINDGQVDRNFIVKDTNGDVFTVRGGTGRVGVNDATPDFQLETTGSDGNGYFGITNTIDGDILTVDTNGDVGIGTSTPRANLNIASTDTRQTVLLEGFGSADQTIQFARGDVASNWVMGRDNTGSSFAIDYFTSGTGEMALDSTPYFYINQSGDVGINTNSPDGRLHLVEGSSGATVNGTADEFILENAASAGMSILTPNTSIGRILFGDPENSAVGRIAYDHSDDSMRFRTSGTEHFTILGNGDIGIGTATPAFLLDVDGDVRFGEEGNESGFLFDAGTQVTTMVKAVISSALKIISGTNPTLDADNNIAIDTTEGQFGFYDGTNEVWVDDRISVLSASKMASTTLSNSFYGSYGAAASTTLEMNAPYSFEAVIVHCKSDKGTFQVQLSDGTNSTEGGTCSSTESTISLSTNNTWNEDEQVQVIIGTQTGEASVEFLDVKGKKTQE